MNSAIKYFDTSDDMYIPERWHIKSPQDASGERIIPRRLLEGNRVDLPGLAQVSLIEPGRALDFSLSEYPIPIVSARFFALFQRLRLPSEVQFIPARVEGHEEPYFILNPLRVIRCIDDARSGEVKFWEPQHGEPERVGHYRNVYGMRINATRVGEAQIFRPWGWTVALIVSERVKQAIEEEGLLGPKFKEV